MRPRAIAALLAGLAAATAAEAAERTRYEVRFDVTWTAESHPLEYPTNAHFSGLIGASHDDIYRIFEDGAQASLGLKGLAERGSHSPLNAEIAMAIQNRRAGTIFESGPLYILPGSFSTEFNVDSVHPYVSVVAKISPSPDWFTGVSSVPLRRLGRWIDAATYTLFAWDAGTDSGTTYAARGIDTRPRQSVRLLAAPQFKDEGGLKRLGSVTFTRIKESAGN